MGKLLTHLTSVGDLGFSQCCSAWRSSPACTRKRPHPLDERRSLSQKKKKFPKKISELLGPGVKKNKDSADILNGKTVDSPHTCEGSGLFPVLFCLALLSHKTPAPAPPPLSPPLVMD